MSVGMAEVLFKKVATRAFFTDDYLEGVDASKAKGKWFIEIGVLRDATVHGNALGMIEVDDDSWFTGSAPGNLSGKIMRVGCRGFKANGPQVAQRVHCFCRNASITPG